MTASTTNFQSLVTINSELLSYSAPQDIKSFRSETALLVKAWKEYDQQLMQENDRDEPSYENPTGEIQDGEINVLTIEMPSGNIIARAIQPNLLLAVVGSVPPRGDPDFTMKFYVEAKGDERYPTPGEIPGHTLGDLYDQPSLQSDHQAMSPEGSEPVNQSNTQQSEQETHSEGQSSKSGTGTQTPINVDEVAEEEPATDPRTSPTGLSDQEKHDIILNFQRIKLDQVVDALQDQFRRHNFVFKEDR
jgi:hypothetical protein